MPLEIHEEENSTQDAVFYRIFLNNRNFILGLEFKTKKETANRGSLSALKTLDRGPRTSNSGLGGGPRPPVVNRQIKPKPRSGFTANCLPEAKIWGAF